MKIKIEESEQNLQKAAEIIKEFYENKSENKSANADQELIKLKNDVLMKDEKIKNLTDENNNQLAKWASIYDNLSNDNTNLQKQLKEKDIIIQDFQAKKLELDKANEKLKNELEFSKQPNKKFNEKQNEELQLKENPLDNLKTK